MSKTQRSAASVATITVNGTEVPLRTVTIRLDGESVRFTPTMLRVLHLLGCEDRAMSLDEIAQSLRVAKPTADNAITDLEGEGMLVFHRGGHFSVKQSGLLALAAIAARVQRSEDADIDRRAKRLSTWLVRMFFAAAAIATVAVCAGVLR